MASLRRGAVCTVVPSFAAPSSPRPIPSLRHAPLLLPGPPRCRLAPSSPSGSPSATGLRRRAARARPCILPHRRGLGCPRADVHALMAAPAPGPLGLVEEDEVGEEDGLLDGFDDEDGLLGAEEPVFHAPVVFSLPGVTSDARAFSQRLAELRSSGLGEVVCGITAGSRGAPQRVDLSEPSGSVGFDVPYGDAGAHCDSMEGPPGEPRRPVPPRQRQPLMTDDPADLADDACGSQNDDCAPALVPLVPLVAPASAARRPARPGRTHTPPQSMEVALTACVRRACGLPTSTPVGRTSSPFRATVVGDPGSRSRAIALRFGGVKRDAILWVSSRGGLMCSCFVGTQNALFLSASSRSSDCQHTSMLRSCISDSGVLVAKFRKRMQLADMAADFGACNQYGSSVVWTVLYQSVFSLVTFTAGNVASCVAPGCRRFRSRCGHVKVARPLQASYKMLAPDATAETRVGPGATTISGAVADSPAPFLVSADEDEGIEKLPGATERAKSDADEDKVAKRSLRNLLPCAGELADGAVWAPTADWNELCRARAAADGKQPSDNLNQMRQLLLASSLLGHVRDPSQLLVEDQCSSCGQRRDDQHEVIKEAATLYTHHPSAPTISVSDPLLCVRAC